MGVMQQPPLPDFAATAAVIAQLDAVVCVDTSVAHLAGAMGKDVHILIPYGAVDWRWRHGCINSPWYPSARLWRQGDEPWSAVLERVAEHLS